MHFNLCENRCINTNLRDITKIKKQYDSNNDKDIIKQWEDIIQKKKQINSKKLIIDRDIKECDEQINCIKTNITKQRIKFCNILLGNNLNNCNVILSQCDKKILNIIRNMLNTKSVKKYIEEKQISNILNMQSLEYIIDFHTADMEQRRDVNEIYYKKNSDILNLDIKNVEALMNKLNDTQQTNPNNKIMNKVIEVVKGYMNNRIKFDADYLQRQKK